MLIVVDWFEYSDSLLFNSLPVTKLQGTSGKETPKLSCQVMRVTAGIKTLSGPNVKMPVYCIFSDLFRASCWRTVEFAVLNSSVHQSSVLFSEALVFKDRIRYISGLVIAFF